MPQSAPIAGESEEKYVSDAIPEEDGEKRPTPNAEIYDSGPGWFSKVIGKPAMGVPPEGSPSVPVKDSRRPLALAMRDGRLS
jgi:hypothetical protein